MIRTVIRTVIRTPVTRTVIRTLLITAMIFLAKTVSAQYVEEFFDDEGRRWRCIDDGREVVCRLLSERRQRPPAEEGDD